MLINTQELPGKDWNQYLRFSPNSMKHIKYSCLILLIETSGCWQVVNFVCLLTVYILHLMPYKENDLEIYPVTRAVNSPKNDRTDLVNRLPE
jgi:hypothetical protein